MDAAAARLASGAVHGIRRLRTIDPTPQESTPKNTDPACEALISVSQLDPAPGIARPPAKRLATSREMR